MLLGSRIQRATLMSNRMLFQNPSLFLYSLAQKIPFAS